MAVTRIKNNQITDNTVEYQKLKDGTLVGAKFNANLTLNSNVSIVGNLQVTGNTTTVNSINTLINDPLVIFNNGYTGSPSYDVGMLVNRNLGSLNDYGSVNTAFVWSETDGAFIAVLTTETGTTTGAINRSYFANAKVGNLIAVHSANVGSMLSGQILASGNIVAASGTVASSYTTGALVVPGGGGVGITGTLYVQGQSSFQGNINAGNIVLSGNINVPVGGTFSNTGVFFGNAAGIGALYAGTSVYTALPHTVLQMSANIDTYSQVNFQNINNGTSASTDFVATADNGDDTDGYINLGINSSTYSDANYPIFGPNDGYLINHGINNVGNLIIVNHAGGPANGIGFSVGGFDPGNVKMQIYRDGVFVTANTQSNSISTGAVIVSGGMAVNGNIHAAAINGTPIGNTNPSTGAFTSLTVNGAAFTSVSSGNAQITGGNVTGVSNLSATDAVLTTAAVTNLSTANAVITGGYVTGLSNLAVTGATTSGGNLVAAATTTSTSTTTGALVVIGGVGIGGNVNVGEDLYVTGNLTVQGNSTTLNVNTLDVEDKNITIAKGSINSAAADGAGLTIDGANATLTYVSTGDQFVFNKTVKAPTLNASANVYLKPQDGVATVTIEPLIIGTIDNMSIGATQSANVVASGLRATTSLFAAPTGTIWLRGGTGTSGINNIPIGAVTPASGVFTLLDSQTGNFTTSNVTNGNITTLVATNISSANVTVAGPVIATGNVVAAATTSSTNTTTGALVVQGGAGIAGNINVGGQIVTTAAGSATDGAGQLYLNGTTSNRIDWNTNGTGAPALTTRSTGTKVVLYPSLSASTTDYAMGIDAATMWSSVPENGASFNFKWYGAATEVASLSGTGVLKVAGNIVTSSGTASTSTTTGALVVVGGAGVSGNLNLGGNLVITGAINSPGNIIVNSTKSAATDFGVRGANDNSLVYAFADSTYDQVVIGGNITTANVSQGAKLHVNSTDAMIIPSGFTAQRPGSSGYTDVEGMIRFNKTLTSLEFFDGSIWQGTGTSFTVITSTLFSGANVDGINANFTLPASATTNGTIISINGVVQIPTSAYSISGNLITFTEAPAIGDVIDARSLTTTAQVTTIASDNGFNQLIVDNNYFSIWTGTSSTVERWRIDTSGNLLPVGSSNIGTPANRVNFIYASNINLSGGTISGVTLTGGPIDDTPIGGNIGNTGNFTTLTANVFQANTSVTIVSGLLSIDDTSGFSITAGTTGRVDSFDKTVHRSGKFLVQLSAESLGEYQSAEVMVVHNGTTATIETYAVTFTGAANLATFSANVSGSTININASATANVNVKSFATLMKIQS